MISRHSIILLFDEKDTRINLNSIIINKNLDWFWFMSEKSTIAELLVKIKTKKIHLQLCYTLSEADFDSNISAKIATIVGQGSYTGIIILNYPTAKSFYELMNNEYFNRSNLHFYLNDKKYGNI